MVDCARLESVYTARYREFESLSLRSVTNDNLVIWTWPPPMAGSRPWREKRVYRKVSSPAMNAGQEFPPEADPGFIPGRILARGSSSGLTLRSAVKQ